MGRWERERRRGGGAECGPVVPELGRDEELGAGNAGLGEGSTHVGLVTVCAWFAMGEETVS